ncbi:MAG: hypothetical protein V2A56_10805 [bacterium]
MKKTILVLLCFSLPFSVFANPQAGLSLGGQAAFNPAHFSGSWERGELSPDTYNATWEEMGNVIPSLGLQMDWAPRSPFALQTELAYQRVTLRFHVMGNFMSPERIIHEFSIRPLARWNFSDIRLLIGPSIAFLMGEGYYLLDFPMQVVLGTSVRIGKDYELSNGWTVSPQIGFRTDLFSSLRTVPVAYSGSGFADQSLKSTEANTRIEFNVQFFF